MSSLRRRGTDVDGRRNGDLVRAVFLGSGTFAVPVLRRLASHPDVTLVGIVTAPERPVGRHQVLAPTPVGLLAAELGLEPVLTPSRLREPASVDAIRSLAPDLAVLADYGQIVPQPLLELRHGALNLHPSLLPRHRGASPVPATILAGDTLTGVTLMRMDAGLDTGPVVAQSRFALDGTERADELEAELADEAAILLADHLGPWLDGELEAVPQNADGATLTRSLRREDGRLDPARPAGELERQVRALQPWPGTFVDSPFGRIKVFASEVLPSLPAQQPGELVDDGLDGLALVTGSGRLRLLEVQPAGGRRMTGSELARGLRNRPSGATELRP
jgi:methionyl-tRNA formyltransferase